MSNAPENEFDLEKLFLPAWAQEPASAKSYAKYQGEEQEPQRRQERHGQRAQRRGGPPGTRRQDNRSRGERRGPPRQERDGRRPQGGDDTGARGQPQREPRQQPAPLPEIEVTLNPEDKGVESLARQIKITGRAYPLFGIAQMILQKPERHSVVLSVRKNADGKALQPLFVCALDDTPWLSEDEAVAHVLKNHFNTFYQAERTATEPPKGKYTFVAQCGMSGVILGPPNHHDYHSQLSKLHTERFSRIPFEVFKSRVKIVREEEVVKKWIDEQSWKTEYVCLNMPESLRLGSLEAVEKHFRENHKANMIKPVESCALGGNAARNLRCGDLVRLVRSVWEDQRRFPLQIATSLSQQFAALGLQFFKVNKTITHVCVARPHYLDMEATPVSEGVKRIVEHINAHSRCSRRQLLGALAPPQPAASDGQATPQTGSVGPSPEQTAVSADLHWLIHQGHVMEFADGTLETAKKPAPKLPKPETKTAAKPIDAAAQGEPVAASAPSASPAKVEGGAAPIVQGPSAETERAAEEAAPAEPHKATPDTGPSEPSSAAAVKIPVEPSVASVDSPS